MGSTKLKLHWGARAIRKVTGLKTEPQVYYMVGKLAGLKKVGKKVVFDEDEYRNSTLSNVSIGIEK